MNAFNTAEKISENITSKERFWAAAAHLSTLLTLFVAVLTLGIGAVPFVAIPLIIYLSFKDQSDYVRDQALQAFALQILISVGFFVGLIVLSLILALIWLVSGLLVFILVGFILLPIAALITVAVVLALICLPFAVGILAIMAAAQTAEGRDFSYPYMDQLIAAWTGRKQDSAEPRV